MKTPLCQAGDAGELRLQAEETVQEKAAQSPDNLEALRLDETRRMLHELQVHQIELEMQNEELRRARGELEASRARYFELYDLAPVGFLTVSEPGLILEANLAAAGLLGMARSTLVKQRISRFILAEDQTIYSRHRQELFETGARQVCTLRMLRSDTALFWARLEAATAQDVDGARVCRAVVSDITEQLALERKVLDASEREQRRIGVDLHDGLCQGLTAIELLCASLKSDLPCDRPELHNQAAQMGLLLREAIRQTRMLAHGLTGFRLTSQGLSSALTELAQSVSSLGRVRCRYDCPEPVSFNDPTVVGHLYRIAQEAVHNAVKHSQGSQVTILLTQQEGALRLQVSDDGKGLHPRPRNPGMGLQVMQHRATIIGAQLNVESRPGQGVTLTCAWRRGESEALHKTGGCQ